MRLVHSERQMEIRPMGLRCLHCGFTIGLPLGDKLGRVDAVTANAVINDMEAHIKEKHWLQNIPSTKEQR